MKTAEEFYQEYSGNNTDRTINLSETYLIMDEYVKHVQEQQRVSDKEKTERQLMAVLIKNIDALLHDYWKIGMKTLLKSLDFTAILVDSLYSIDLRYNYFYQKDKNKVGETFFEEYTRLQFVITGNTVKIIVVKESYVNSIKSNKYEYFIYEGSIFVVTRILEEIFVDIKENIDGYVVGLRKFYFHYLIIQSYSKC